MRAAPIDDARIAVNGYDMGVLHGKRLCNSRTDSSCRSNDDHHVVRQSQIHDPWPRKSPTSLTWHAGGPLAGCPGQCRPSGRESSLRHSWPGWSPAPRELARRRAHQLPPVCPWRWPTCFSPCLYSCRDPSVNPLERHSVTLRIRSPHRLGQRISQLETSKSCHRRRLLQ